MLRDRDRGAKKLLEALEKKHRKVLRVGVLGDDKKKGSDGAITVLDVANWMEFGTDKIPSRSFIRAYVDENHARIVEMLRRVTVQVVEGKLTQDQALNLVGLKIVGEIQARIAGGIEPENAESTIKRKGSSVPLIDTGQLRSSVTHDVVKP